MRFLLAALLALICSTAMARDWRTASRAPVGLAPDAAATREAVIQVYGARTLGWKSAFGVHTWVAVKPTNAQQWKVYEVIGWRLRYSDNVVVISNRDPDGRWFGSEPELYADKRGARLSVRGRVRSVARPQLQHVYRLADARGAGVRSGSAGYGDR
jgi:hypothetical protein